MKKVYQLLLVKVASSCLVNANYIFCHVDEENHGEHDEENNDSLSNRKLTPQRVLRN